MKHENVWETLVDSVIAVAAREGIEKITTRKIAAEAKLAEAYIYQYSEDKVDLIERSFLEVRSRIGYELARACKSFEEIEVSLESIDQMSRTLWFAYWNYLMEHEDELKFFLGFHHSGYFTDEMNHVWPPSFQAFGQLMQRVDGTFHFTSALNLWVHIRHVETGTLDMALAYLRNQFGRDEAVVEEIYGVIMRPLTETMKEHFRGKLR